MVLEMDIWRWSIQQSTKERIRNSKIKEVIQVARNFLETI